LGRTAEAEQVLRAGLAAAPDNRALANNLALVLTLEGRAAEAVAICGPLTRRVGATARMANNCGIAQAAAGDRNAAQATLSGRINADDLETIATGLGGGRMAPAGAGPARAGTPVSHVAPAETASSLAAAAPAQAPPGASMPPSDTAIGRRSVRRSASPTAPEAAPPAASDAQAATRPASGT
jgi:hypothetical protein